MSIKQFLLTLKKNNIDVSVAGQDIEVQFDGEDIDKDILNELRKNKSDIVAYLNSITGKQNARNIIPVISDQANYRISSSQRRLWILSQIEESSIAYNMPYLYIFEGRLDIDCLNKAFNHILFRHEILRTFFVQDDDGEIKQKIGSNEINAAFINHIDLRESHDPSKKVDELVNAEFVKPFDLSTGPLIRANLFQISDKKWVFSCVMHHIISDGWSINILIKELFAFYNTFRKKLQNPFKPLRIQYKDYSEWQQEQLSNGSFNGHKTYWLSQFENEIPLLELPTDRLRQPIKTYNGGIVSKQISKELSYQFKEIVERDGATLFMGLLALVNTLLYRYSDQNDIIIGSPIAGRDHIDLDEQIGFYVNTLALRVKFKKDDSFLELLKKTKQVTLDAYEHQEYPFDELINDLNLERDMSRNALFDVMVILQNISNSNVHVNQQFEDLQIKEYEGENYVTSKFDLTFTFTESYNGIILGLEYNSDLYNRETVERISEHLECLLDTIVQNPKQSIFQLDYLSAIEKKQLLVQFNNSNLKFKVDYTIVSLFEEQVELTPSSPALIFEDKLLCYHELNQKANQFCNYLIKNYNIKFDDLIGINLERSEKLIISMLGILKSGAAYLPIDPGYPQERIDFIISDSNCKVVIDDLEYEKFLKFSGEYESKNLKLKNKLSDLAYVIYTSGSTGMPKGCEITHENLSNYILWANSFYFKENVPSNFGLYTSIAFDLTITSIYCALTRGSILYVFNQHMNIDDILKYSFDINSIINAIKLTPSHVNILEQYGLVSNSIQTAIIGGEEVKPMHVEILKRINPDIRIFNEYGPTETTVGCIVKELELNTKVTIGYPISNCRIFILNEHEELQPINVPGYINIGGKGLAKGYINRPKLTSEKFVQSRFCDEGRIYKTGDIGRWLPDGSIEYLGRKDDQVKIRGYRIELGEIEIVLKNYVSIEKVAVLSWLNKDNEKELVAYLVAKDELNISELRYYLGAHLPSYMIPDRFVQIDDLPLTSNGKVDRKQLPNPETLSIDTGIEYISARNETEEKLIEVWANILGINKNIGVLDNFFELGGHSLKATRLVSQIHKIFLVRIGLKEIFTNPILEKQASLILKGKKIGYSSILPLKSKANYELSSSQRRLWILSQMEGGNIAYNMFGTYIFSGKLDIDSLSLAFNSLIDRHEILRTVFRKDKDGKVFQWIKPSLDHHFKIEFKDALGNDNSSSELVIKEITKSFDLENGPLLSAHLIRIDYERYILTYTMHHIISDGWSIGVLIKELMLLYNSYVEGTENSLEPLKIQYKDYAAWQQEQLSGEQLKIHKNYWLKQFSGELPILNLPTDYARPIIKTYNGNIVSICLDKELSDGLRLLSRKNEGTLFMSLLAVIKTLLHRYTSQEDIIVGSPIAGREHPDLEDQIGFYVNTLALRTKLNGNNSFNELLANVKQMTLEAYEHQIYPFDELLEELDLQRDLSRQALFDVMVVLQNADKDDRTNMDLAFGNIKVSAYEEKMNTSSKFDLLFDFKEINGLIKGSIEYNTDIYSLNRIERLGKHLINIVNVIVKNPDLPIKDIDFLSLEEKHTLLFDFNNTLVDYPLNNTVIDLFEEQVSHFPNNCAVVFGEKRISYKELNDLSNRLSGYLINDHKVKKGDFVGIILDRSEQMVMGILAILKCGGIYVPIDPEYPLDRILYILEETQIKTVLTDSGNIDLCDRLQWEVESFKSYIVLDSKVQTDFSDIELVTKQLWNYVTEESVDEITASGWKSSYTGATFSKEEVDEIVSNVVDKLAPFLNPSSRVLEVGCGSGLIMFNISGNVKSYVGTDISNEVLNLCADKIKSNCFQNIELFNLTANELDTLKDYEFDIIIVNSVIQYFPSHEYLRKFLMKATNLLSNEGVLFLGDIRDKTLQLDYYKDLYKFSENSSEQIIRKKYNEEELFLDKVFLKDYFQNISYKTNVDFSNKVGKIENELKVFRYDALIEINKEIKKEKTGGNFLEKLQIFELPLPYDNKKTFKPVVLDEDVAYIIYTSGSTGKPKGVQITHRNLSNLLNWGRDIFSKKTEGMLASTSVSFDLSIFELFVPLITGNKIILSDNILDLPNLICKEEVTVLNTVPSAIKALLDTGELPPKTSVINLAGESLKLDLVKKIYERSTIQEIFNLYGPSETTTYSTYSLVKKNSNSCTIGKPISNTQIYIVDSQNNLIPFGVIGEICIAGEGLSKGYLNKPEFTAEKFVSNPFEEGKRMYKTGDMGRWLEDGNIEFLGRIDDQVKIRGYRIEIGEIETALLEHKSINSAVVIAKELGNGDIELIAYLVSDQRDLNTADIRSYLSIHLPSFMIPGYYVQLDKLPLTPNGKINKKLLPDPEGLSINTGTEYVAPRNEIEEKLVEIWNVVLRRNKIGIKDNFYELGGNSLKSVKVLNLINKEFNINFKLSVLYSSNTIEELSKNIEDYNLNNVNNSKYDIITLNKNDSISDNIFFIPPFFGIPLFFKPLSDKLSGRTNCYGFYYKGLNANESFSDSILEAAEEFSQKILKFRNNGQIIVFGYSMGAAIAYEIVKKLEMHNVFVKLIIVDYSTAYDDKFEIELEALENINIYKEYKNLFMNNSISESRIQEYLVNNIKILNEYEGPKKHIKSDIFAFECKVNNIPIKMEKWKEYTKGNFVLNFLEGNHWDVLYFNNPETIVNTINNIII